MIRVSTLAVFSLGFRPFYLLAALFAVVSLPLWLGIHAGFVPAGNYLYGMAWHSHEMVFGFAVAVIAGFLLTAVRNWTGLATPTGCPLAALAVLWLLGRVLMIAGTPMLAAVVDVSFLPMLGLAVGIPIWRSRSKRNFKVLVVLGGLALANLSFHLAQLGILNGAIGRLSVVVALDIIMILMAVMGGRVIPSFIANAVPTAKPRHIFGIEVVVMVSLVLILIAEVGSAWIRLPGSVWLLLFLTAAVSNIARLLLWAPLQTRRNPLLLMLPLAYAWIPVSLLLRAVSELSNGISVTLAFHALAVGAIASLMLAMMTRSALGHTGRTLKAGWVEISAFLLLQAAAITRIVPGTLWPQHYPVFLIGSMALWSMAFGIFSLGYWRILTRPRIDATG